MTHRLLLDALGADLPDDLLTVALTHRSYAYEHGGLPTNERLELLGDAVLGLVIVEELFHRHPDSSEGELAKLRNSIVNSQALAGVARGLTGEGLGAYLLLGRGEINTGGHTKSSILADTLESLLGAVYLRHGLDEARRVILRLFEDLIDTAPTLGAALEWKSSLQELTATLGLGVPRYEVSAEGPDHDRRRAETARARRRRCAEHPGPVPAAHRPPAPPEPSRQPRDRLQARGAADRPPPHRPEAAPAGPG